MLLLLFWDDAFLQIHCFNDWVKNLCWDVCAFNDISFLLHMILFLLLCYSTTVLIRLILSHYVGACLFSLITISKKGQVHKAKIRLQKMIKVRCVSVLNEMTWYIDLKQNVVAAQLLCKADCICLCSHSVKMQPRIEILFKIKGNTFYDLAHAELK